MNLYFLIIYNALNETHCQYREGNDIDLSNHLLILLTYFALFSAILTIKLDALLIDSKGINSNLP